eukprot:8266177-Lingulodinium_polyedra.AAC.2
MPLLRRSAVTLTCSWPSALATAAAKRCSSAACGTTSPSWAGARDSSAVPASSQPLSNLPLGVRGSSRSTKGRCGTTYCGNVSRSSSRSSGGSNASA